MAREGSVIVISVEKDSVTEMERERVKKELEERGTGCVFLEYAKGREVTMPHLIQFRTMVDEKVKLYPLANGGLTSDVNKAGT